MYPRRRIKRSLPKDLLQHDGNSAYRLSCSYKDTESYVASITKHKDTKLQAPLRTNLNVTKAKVSRSCTTRSLHGICFSFIAGYIGVAEKVSQILHWVFSRGVFRAYY